MSEFKYGVFLEFNRAVPTSLISRIQDHPGMKISHIMGNHVGIVTMVVHGKDRKEMQWFLDIEKQQSFAAATEVWED